LAAWWFLFTKLPTLLSAVIGSGGLSDHGPVAHRATLSRTQKILDRVRDHYLINEKENVKSAFTVAGFSLPEPARTWECLCPAA
jgi:multidrug efflux pump